MKTLTMWQALLSATFFILSAYQTAALANDVYLLPAQFAQKYQSSGDIISEAVALLNTYLLPEKFAQKHQSSDDGLISEVAALVNDGYLPPAKKYQSSDDVISEAAILAKDAYLPPAEFVQKYQLLDCELVSEKASSISYYFFVQERQIIVVFEGTHDLRSLRTDLEVVESHFMGVPGSIVHKGYYAEAQMAYARLVPYLDRDKQIIVTGHSLGGAVGHLLAALLYKEGYRVKLLTFGEPPVGNENFVQSIKGLDHQRYTHIFDVVPLLKKAYIEKLQSALGYLNERLPQTQRMAELMAELESIPYTFVHQGEHHYIHSNPDLPKGYDEMPWYERFVTRVALYHASETYVKGVK